MKTGVIAGNFDVIHPGYIYMFEECKANCDHFMVLLHTDPSIERLDKLKPILSLYERTKILHSISMIDFIYPYDTEAELLGILTDLKPDVRFLGDDYIGKPFTGDNLNIPIHYLNRDHGWSTTKFKQLIAKSLKNEEQ